MSTIFDSIAVRSLPESVFDMSHDVKMSCNMGELVPIFLEEVIPGDTFQVKSEIMIRLAPMLAPVMHRVQVYTHYFYVPNRLVWDNWHDHITGGEDGLANPEHPRLDITDGQKQNYGQGSLADYLGIPPVDPATTITTPLSISAIPFAGYQLIYNEYYRDQDLSTKIEDYKLTDGLQPGTSNLTTLRRRSWQRDYFSSARPNAQKGAQVILPSAEVSYKTVSKWVTDDGSSEDDMFLNQVTQQGLVQTSGLAPDGVGRIENIESISATTVEDQRRANRLQEWLELAQRGGSRINEIIRNFFGVVPDDLRLTRPQYLGGGMQNVIMSEVLNTAGDADGATLQPLGEYGGHGISVGNQNGFRERFKEHGYVFGIMSIVPKPAYYQGIHKHWTKFDKYEKYWPQFANIGEQEITNQEIYAAYDGDTTTRQSTFGYAPRYSEYKYACSKVAGDFRRKDNSPTGAQLSYWHMGRFFDSTPPLNQQFVEIQPEDVHNIFAVQDTSIDKLYCQIHHNFKAKRKMPFHNIPSNMPI